MRRGGSSVTVVAEVRVGWPGLDTRYGHGFLASSPHPDRFWGPPSFLSNGYRGIFPRR